MSNISAQPVVVGRFYFRF